MPSSELQPEPEVAPVGDVRRCTVGGPVVLFVVEHRNGGGALRPAATVTIAQDETVAQITQAVLTQLGLMNARVVVEYEEPEFGEFLLLERIEDLPAERARLRVRPQSSFHSCRHCGTEPEPEPKPEPQPLQPHEPTDRPQALAGLRASIPAELVRRAGEGRCNDSYLMRFLRARDMDVEAAAVMLRECLEWRHSQGLLGGSGDPTAVLSVDDLALETSLRPLLLYDIGRDQRGRPMLIELVGRWDCERIVEFIESGGSGTASTLPAEGDGGYEPQTRPTGTSTSSSSTSSS
eukprot:COSAG06_NODE_10203_length_1728_cov_1.074279_2_plen_291_part_01